MKRTKWRNCACKGFLLALAGLLLILIGCPAQVLCAVTGGLLCFAGGALAAGALWRR